ncbi:anthranilate synthase component I family protein [Desulfitobacterium sp.]|uniref:anthranilate synthase component I family protein n=1 Tax=Desulfitobacterium sp. TaxID=49981 RepID=UPI002BCDDAB4|nr:anthranilate synthase component I family protein [Desulfitobacterium sp.]HVJ50314.1 anthranilate synthase component I family protein [Desulfitobacterium sp.]
MQVAQKEWTLQPYPSNPDWIIDLFRLGETLGEKCFALLEGKEGDHQRTYLGFGEGITLSRQTFDQTGLKATPDPLTHLRWFRQTHVLDQDLESGLIGYLDFEWGLAWQKPTASLVTPDYFFRLCPINLVLLPLSQKLVLEIFFNHEKEREQTFKTWCAALDQFLAKIRVTLAVSADSPAPAPVSASSPIPASLPVSATSPVPPLPSSSAPLPSPALPQKSDLTWTSNLSRDDFLHRIEQIKAYICAGDIFQAVPSQRFIKNIQLNPWDAYQKLRILNPSPYLFCLFADQQTLVGSSPELLLSSIGSLIQTRPIAGTRPRGRSLEEDCALEQELLQDPKEIAEHAMLVDLGRNDLGRVSQYGTVSVNEYAKIQRFSHVMHLVSTVEGHLDPSYDSLDALKAVFPAGTLSGAPKVRALEILQELEPDPRGAYGGALGLMRWNGDLDFCITIRTLVIKGQQVEIQAGAGIVFDSIPEREFEETVHKAQALLKVVDDCVSGP